MESAKVWYFMTTPRLVQRRAFVDYQVSTNKQSLKNLSIFLKNLQITYCKTRHVTRLQKPVQKLRIQLYLQNATRYAMPSASAKRESRTSP
jgi:hypothetical protein